MAHRVCPYWIGFFLNNPLRRFWHNPEEILQPFIKNGMNVLDIGSAMGFFALPMARMAGQNGKVVCVDVQEKMLLALQKNARKAQLSDRIIIRACKSDSLNLGGFEGTIDFAIAFAVVHEVSHPRLFFADILRALKPGASCLIAEPKGHVSVREFEHSVAIAQQAGLPVSGNPKIKRCHAVLLHKTVELV
ncbi:MAG: class I SAM-dependent methyltransferase [Nitrospirota bacterium]